MTERLLGESWHSWKQRTDETYRERNRIKTRALRAANPERFRELSRKYERKRRLRKYGISEARYEEMFLGQDQKCAICFGEDHGGKDWHVDHDHQSGVVRGILCHHCNLLLGNAKDNIMTLNKAIEYLRKSS